MENATETHRSSDGGKINPCPERSWRSARDRLSPCPNRPARPISKGLKLRPDRPAAGRPIGNGLNPCPDRPARPVGDRLNASPNRSSRPVGDRPYPCPDRLARPLGDRSNPCPVQLARPVGDRANPCPDRPGLPESSRPKPCLDGSQRPGGDRRTACPDTTADTPLGPRPSAPANSSEDWPSITPYCVAYLRLPPMAQDQNATVVDGTFRVHMYHTLPDEEEVEADDAGNRLPEDPLPGDSYHDNDDEEEEEKGASLQGWLQEILSGHYNNPESPEQEYCPIDPPCIDSHPNGEIGAACSTLSSPDAASCTDMARPQPQQPTDYPATTRTKSPGTSGDPGTCTETTHLGHSENKSSDTTRPKPLRLQVDHAAKATVPRMPVVTTRTKSPGTRGDQGTENTRLGHSENNSSDTTHPRSSRLQVDYAAKATVPRIPVVTKRGAKGMIKQQSNLGHLRVSRDDDSRQHSTSTSASDVTIAMETSGESADSDDTQTTGGDTQAHYENVTEKTAQNCLISGWKSLNLKTSTLLLVLAAVAVIVGLVVILTYQNGPIHFGPNRPVFDPNPPNFDLNPPNSDPNPLNFPDIRTTHQA
ncbi:PREDICTED: sialidase-like [Branchiostoma belcheri]|uniref:Sialidase-like n=1 Tax=Branchiostoma belcheri TaxID=7741 RepID=A0A6P4Z5A8_BRABE|nr:PREDICTED: sialidase-like [Branchiostoma belcheri]